MSTVLCGLDPGPLPGRGNFALAVLGCEAHTHVEYVQDHMWSSSSCEGGSDLRDGGDTADTLIRLDKPIRLPAMLYSLQEVYGSLRPLEKDGQVKAHRTISHEITWFACSCNTLFLLSLFTCQFLWIQRLDLAIADQKNGIFSNYPNINQNLLAPALYYDLIFFHLLVLNFNATICNTFSRIPLVEVFVGSIDPTLRWFMYSLIATFNAGLAFPLSH